MKTTAEMKIEISNARISNVNSVIMPDGSCKLVLEVETTTQERQNNENVYDDCILVEASKLSLTDYFMRHKPGTESEKKIKSILTEVIKNGIEDFYRARMDPSFADKEETKFHYMSGEKPAVGRSYNWWKETVKDSKWCIGTRAQYVAFLGVLIKKLVAKGWTCCEAWDAVCNDSKNLGHYLNSDNAKHKFEDTGSREICGFCDLANTYKILAVIDKKSDDFWVAGGYYYDGGYGNPLADLLLRGNCNSNLDRAVAWLVLKK